MTAPTLQFSSLDPFQIDADVLAVAVAKTADGPRLLLDDERLAGLDLAAIGITGAADEVRRIPFEGAARSLALVGLGVAEPDGNDLRYAAGSVARQLTGIGSLALAFPGDATAVAEGAGIGAY